MWKSHKQKIVSRASTHAEYYALADCVEEVLPLIGVLCDLGVEIRDPVKIYEDNSGAIALSKTTTTSVVECAYFGARLIGLFFRTPILLLLRFDPCSSYRLLIGFTIWISLFSKMASQRRYCVPNCNVTRADKIPMQSFPNPDIHPNRFRTWLPLAPPFSKKKKKKFLSGTRTLSPHAVPTLHLPGFGAPRSVLTDVTNRMDIDQGI
ncbi:hypothetical protein evm_003424 [Chilo suppressalis]|nr:hypothetical protein evm_003424 [Chilo suppressalis]